MIELVMVVKLLLFVKNLFKIKFGVCGIVIRNVDMKVVDIIMGVFLLCNKVGEICI